jgi:hypothetical protein
MGIDLNKMRQKHAALTNKGGGDTNDFFWVLSAQKVETHSLRHTITTVWAVKVARLF